MCWRVNPCVTSIADAPEIVLLNERQINNLYSYINEGTIREIVEISRETDTKEGRLGIKKLIELQFGASNQNEEGEEKVRDVNTVGKFAVLYSNLDNDGDLTVIDELDEATRDSFTDGQYIESRGQINPSPVNSLQNAIDEFTSIFQSLGMADQIHSKDDNISMSQIQDVMRKLNSKTIYISKMYQAKT